MSQGIETPPDAPVESGLARPQAPKHSLDLSRIAQDLQIRKVQVESVVQLLDEGNTIPFITRYRKERTGGLNEEIIRQIQTRVQYLRQLADRKQTILKSIEGQGKLTEELRAAILAADTSKRLEDLYLPYKPKKRTLASEARERGLEPLALALWNREPAVANLAEILPGMLNPEKGLATIEDVLLGVQHILAEQVAETADVRAGVRKVLWESGKLCTSKSESVPEGQGLEYKDYFQFSESARHIPPHRILAINRGEKEGALKGRLEWDNEAVQHAAVSRLPLADHPHAEFLKKVLDDALSRLLLPSLEREIRRELTEESEEHAVRVFARNLRSLLLQPPLRGRRVLAVDPGIRTGCKLAALDETGNLLEHDVVYLFPKSDRSKPKPKRREESAVATAPATAAGPASTPEAAAPAGDSPVPAAPTQESPPSPAARAPAEAAQPAERAAPAPEPTPAASAAAAEPAPATSDAPAPAPEAAVSATAQRDQAKKKLEELVQKHQVNVIAIGNGTACRDTEELVTELIKERLPELAYVIVNEAGASVYSASAIGREEFPGYDATLRGTISIGRRLQDPLSELVKIDPQNVGVGLYQHDIHPRRLKESLEAVIESCVNYVGVDVNTASVPLLRHVSGLNQLAARELVAFRKQHGPFKTREQLLQVPNVGPVRFVQAAGFLKIGGGDNPLDQTWVHPESYPAAQTLLSDFGFDPGALLDKQKTAELTEKSRSVSVDETSARLGIGVPTLKDILEALTRPGRDPREDLPPPIFKKGILKLEDLQPGMELKGTVLNVVDFGAFVDIGLKDSGLVHISQIANRYIKNPYDVVAVGDVVTVWVLSVDQQRRRVSLTMIRPGTERKAPERKPQTEQRPQRGARPPRGRRPPPGRQAAQAPRPSPARTEHQPPSEAAAVSGPAAQPAPPRPAPPPPRPRKPHRAAPKPKLSKAALEGAAPLRTFSELKAFFDAQHRPVPKPPEETGGNGSAPPAQ
jgi:protein Tex